MGRNRSRNELSSFTISRIHAKKAICQVSFRGKFIYHAFKVVRVSKRCKIPIEIHEVTIK